MNPDFIESNNYEKFLNFIEKEIDSNEFQRQLKKVQNIDLKHYTKFINILEMRRYLNEYKNEPLIKNDINKVLIILPGNPEIVFKLCLEAIRYNVTMTISIEDFCLAQNTLLVEVVNKVIEKCKLKNKINLKNMLSDVEIIEQSKNVDKTIIIGNSNTYNRLENRIRNLELNSYGIFEIYSDSEEFESLERTVYDYLVQNEFESELYDDIEFEDAIKLINKKGYGFCSILLSKDKEKQKIFKENIKSKYVIVNKNPFKEIKFKLEIKK
ncbi:MAG: hypothetical protein IKL55_00810 [Clostridia bacterium]|nr:hypothetical protein [Clostridia bacterium]